MIEWILLAIIFGCFVIFSIWMMIDDMMHPSIPYCKACGKNIYTTFGRWHYLYRDGYRSVGDASIECQFCVHCDKPLKIKWVRK